jgi:hypothetical protein
MVKLETKNYSLVGSNRTVSWDVSRCSNEGCLLGLVAISSTETGYTAASYLSRVNMASSDVSRYGTKPFVATTVIQDSQGCIGMTESDKLS